MTESLIDILVISPRIEQLNLEVHEILQISGHEDQLMLDGYRCDLSIGCGRGGGDTITVSRVPPYQRSAVRGNSGLHPYDRVCIIDGEAKYYGDDRER